MSIFLRPQRAVLPVDAAGRELLEYPHPAFPCFMELADLSQYPDVPWHWHEVVELCLVREGAMDFHTGGQVHRLLAGEGGFTNRNILHTVHVVPGVPALTAAIQFSPELLTGGGDSALYRQLVAPVLTHRGLDFLHLRPAVPWQREALDHVRAILGHADTRGQELLITAHLAQIWHLLLNHALEPLPVSEAGIQAARRVKVMLQFIHAHYAEPLTLAAIAAAANVSVRECTRCFAQVIGSAPVAYLVSYRISMAAALLETTALPITEVCVQTGFNHPSYFTRTFVRQMGMTPRAYRAAHLPRVSADPMR